MEWFKCFQLFLFDFDGLLVDTESVHMEAYRLLCEEYGFELTWSFTEYCRFAHASAEGLRQALYEQFPEMGERCPDWAEGYRRKTELYSQLVREGRVQLMPGAAQLLKELSHKAVKRAVITHSPLSHIELIRCSLPVLNTIEHWITREDYLRPKPSPDSYQVALQRFLRSGERAVGFEDSPRGLQALTQTSAQAVFVAKGDYPLLSEALALGVIHITSLEELLCQRSLSLLQ